MLFAPLFEQKAGLMQHYGLVGFNCSPAKILEESLMNTSVKINRRYWIAMFGQSGVTHKVQAIGSGPRCDYFLHVSRHYPVIIRITILYKYSLP